MSDIQIDWRFIGALEGQSVLDGYIPDTAISQSGVTIATGVDLGQITTASDLPAQSLPPGLAEKLAPYCGLKTAAATAYLAAHPLSITRTESDALDAAIRASAISALSFRYAAGAAGGTNLMFAALNPAAQTVIASVAFQYGPALAVRTPRFWRVAVSGDWTGVIGELEDFGDRYPMRRRREAAYLRAWLGIVG